MRALIAVIVCLVVLSVTTAIWRQKRAGGRVEIELSVWGMPFENGLYLNDYIPEFERLNPNIAVHFHHFDNYSSRILMLRAGGIARRSGPSTALVCRDGCTLLVSSAQAEPR